LQNMATRTSERRRAASADAFARLFPSAANTESMRRSAARGACFFSRALTCPRPAVFSVAGVGQRVSRSATAGWSRRGAQGPFQGRVDLGEQSPDPVGRGGLSADEGVIEAASTPGSASVSSSGAVERRVCGIVRAASAMVAASPASVLAFPGCRSDPPHRQIAHRRSGRLGNRDRQRADGRRLVRPAGFSRVRSDSRGSPGVFRRWVGPCRRAYCPRGPRPRHGGRTSRRPTR
jgi:hypothetical protein